MSKPAGNAKMTAESRSGFAMKTPTCFELSKNQIDFIAQRGGVMTVFTSRTVVG